MRPQTKKTKDLLERITLAWANVVCGTKTPTLDGKTGMSEAKEMQRPQTREYIISRGARNVRAQLD